MRLNRTELATHLLTLRPTLSPATITSYVSILMNIYFQTTHDGNAESVETDWFGDNTDAVIQIIQDRPVTSRSTILSCISVIINDKPKSTRIREELVKAVRQYDTDASTGVKSAKQEENWMDYNEILGIWTEYQTVIDHLITTNLNKDHPFNKLQFQKFLLLSLTTGKFFPPRRSEWATLKYRDYDAEKDNYIDFERKVFVLNKYKTAKYFGRMNIDICDELLYYIHHFIRIVNPKSEYFFCAGNGNRWINARITCVLNEVFDRKISTSMLRHIYKSHHHPDMETLAKLTEESRQMGHGLKQSLQYIKH